MPGTTSSVFHTAERPKTSTPIPGDLVGKKQNAEVLITDWRPLTDTTHRVLARWPHTHGFYKPGPDSYSPLLFTETIRQALALLSHTAHHVPLEYRLGWERYTSSLHPVALRASGSSPHVELTVTHREIAARRKAGPVRLVAKIVATRDGEPLGTAELHHTAYPPALYDRIRGNHADARQANLNALPPAPPASPASVGRTQPEDVVLAPTGTPRRWQLRTDTTNRVLFDHPHDHVPGMVLLEAAAQAAQALTGPRRIVPVSFLTHFQRYTELDAPCWIEAAPPQQRHAGTSRTHIRGIQSGQTTFATQLTFQT